MGPNPYLQQMGAQIGDQISENYKRNIAPGIRSNAIAAGGYGGSRQGVVEANMYNDMGKNLTQGLTNLYGSQYDAQQNRNLAQQGITNNYDLGLRNNDLGFGQLDFNIHQGNVANGFQAANFGLGVQNQLQNNNLTGINAGTNIQNTPLEYQKYLNSFGNASGGAGGNRTSNNNY